MTTPVEATASLVVPPAPALRLLMIEQGGRGGVADYTGQLAAALGKSGCQVLLATAADHRYAPAAGVTVHKVFHYVRGRTWLARQVRRRGFGAVANGIRFLASIPRLVRLARRSDVVHSQGWEFSPLGLLAVACVRLTGVPVIQTLHNTFERDRPRDATHRALARLTARTIVHTRADLERVPRTATGRVVVIPHGEYGVLAQSGGYADRRESRDELGIPHDTPVTLLFGQLRPDKGLGDLLTALARVPRLHVLIGGQDTGALTAVADQLARPEVAQRITLREGFLSMSEAATLFAAADTVVLPYRMASQSGVLLLAYGFRRPVIIYPVGGLVEAVVDGETGWICARPDMNALADALRASVDAGWVECQRRGNAGYRLADERFAWSSAAAATSAVYRDVIASR